jgi:hypothetical protein
MTAPNRGLKTLSNPYGAAPSFDRPGDKLSAEAQARYAAIRNNPDLTPQAKTKQIAKVFAATSGQLQQMAADDAAKREASTAAAKRRLFGNDDMTAGMTPAEAVAVAMSARDAAQRVAAATTPAEVQALFDTASQSGDEILARAAGNRALADAGKATFGSDGLTSVAEAYLAARPAKAQALADIGGPPGLDLHRSSEFFHPAPPEVARLLPGQIAALANDGGS